MERLQGEEERMSALVTAFENEALNQAIDLALT